MAKDKLTEYDATANNNTVVGDVNLAENSMNPSDVNNAIREIMSHQKEAFGSGTPLYVDQTNNRVGVNKTPTVALDVSGETKLSSHLNMGDNDQIKLGAGADLSLYHDGSNSYITEGGTGALYALTNSLIVRNSANSESMLTATENGAVELYHNDSKKLETTSSGIDVTGGVTTNTASTSTSAFSFANQLNNSNSSNDSIVALGFHNRADVNATGVGGAIALLGGGTSGGSGNLIFCIKDATDIANVVDVADEKMRINASGQVTKPLQVSFRCGRNASYSTTGNVSPNWNVVFHNVGGHFNTSTGIFTAPVAGVYQVNLYFLNENNTNASDVFVRLNGVQNNGIRIRSGTSAGHQTSSGNAAILMAVNDTLDVFLSTGEIYNDTSTTWSVFSAYLLG